jgi:hypothetical protein
MTSEGYESTDNKHVMQDRVLALKRCCAPCRPVAQPPRALGAERSTAWA